MHSAPRFSGGNPDWRSSLPAMRARLDAVLGKNKTSLPVSHSSCSWLVKQPQGDRQGLVAHEQAIKEKITRKSKVTFFPKTLRFIFPSLRANHGHGGHESGVRSGVFGGDLSNDNMSAGGRGSSSRENPCFWGRTSKVRPSDGSPAPVRLSVIDRPRRWRSATGDCSHSSPRSAPRFWASSNSALTPCNRGQLFVGKYLIFSEVAPSANWLGCTSVVY